MKTMIENLINGNLIDAKKQAKRFKSTDIRNYLVEEYGYSFKKATLAASYLKGKGSFQAYCNAE